MTNLAVTCMDTSWLNDHPWKILLTCDDRTRLLACVRRLLVPRLSDAVMNYLTNDVVWRIEADNGSDLAEKALSLYQQAFAELGDSDTVEAFARAIEMCRQRATGPGITRGISEQDSADPARVLDAGETSRSIFADIEEGDL
jgi:hypothetical protein